MPPITVFISHRWAEGEHEFAMELAKRLASYRDLKVIIDEDDLKAGVNIEKWMRRAVKLADVFLFLMTPLSLESPNCQLELNVARKGRKPIVPMLLRNATLPNALAKLKYVDLRNAKSLPFAKIEEIVEVIKYHSALIEQGKSPTRAVEKTKGIGSQSLTALSVTDNVQIGAWIIPISKRAPQFQVASSMLFVSMTNLTTIPREVIVDARIKGDHVKFGPFPDLTMAEKTDQQVRLPINQSIEIGFPFSVARDYVSGSAAFVIASGGRLLGARKFNANSVSISLPVTFDDLEFKVFA